MTTKIYLDNNATTQIEPEVLDSMIAEYAKTPQNPSSIHSYGQLAKQTVTKSRSDVAKFLNVDPSEIIFTSGGTEGINMLIKGLITGPSMQIIASPIDHSCIYNTLEELKKFGHKVSYLPVSENGYPEAKNLKKYITPSTDLIILTAANGETGVKPDLEELASIAENLHIPLVIDGVALICKEPFSIPKGVAGMAFSAHKFHGPQGVGFVYLNSKNVLTPLITGGGQENNKRSGTENIPGIVGLAKALEICDPAKNYAMLIELREYFESRLIDALPDIEINGSGPRVANTSNVYIPNVEAETLLIALDMEGISASYATACASMALEPSRTLLNMGYSSERARSSIRFSFSRMNTKKEIEKACDIIIKVTKKLKKNPLFKNFS